MKQCIVLLTRYANVVLKEIEYALKCHVRDFVETPPELILML
jgi:hypothetical protein